MDPEFIHELLRVSLMMRVKEKFEEQENEKANAVFWQPWLNRDDGTKPYTKHTTKWKRERRQRPPEYPRKSDPKYSETFGTDPSSPISYDLPDNASNSNGVKTSQIQPDSPLDMTVRQRGLPPSYAQTISNPGYRSSYRPSVIHNGVPPAREELPSGISMCDPIIDEHFRRSLGSDYHTVFRNNASKEKSPPKSPPKMENPSTTSVIELMDSTGLSVDDHFAKALGDTWAKLNRKEPEIKSSSSENGLVSI